MRGRTMESDTRGPKWKVSFSPNFYQGPAAKGWEDESWEKKSNPGAGNGALERAKAKFEVKFLFRLSAWDTLNS